MTHPENAVHRLQTTLARLETYGVRLGLDTTYRLLTALGDPHSKLECVLVGGTNGKGSTAAFLAGMVTRAGYRTGLYTSPHLEVVEERLRIDGTAIETEALAEIVGVVVDTAQEKLGYLPTYFETLTAAAFAWFAGEGVDLAIMEVGMGGRLDATNACQPVVSVLTEIGLEHREYLGDTLDRIAREKAGILRPGRPTIAWVLRPEAKRVIAEVAREIGADLVWGQDLARIGEGTDLGRQGQRFELDSPAGRAEFRLRLAGDHQRENLALAVLAAQQLARRGFDRLATADLSAGAAAVRWPGRLEWIESMVPKPVLLDVAHNPDGGRRLAGALRARAGRFDLLFGALHDKEIDQFLPELASGADQVVLTTPTSPRARDPQDLVPLVPDRAAIVEPDRVVALSRALAGGGEFLVVCGSVYLVGEIRQELRRRFGAPPAAVEPLFSTPSLAD